MKKIYTFCWVLLILGLINSCKKNSRISEKAYSEKLEDWIIPAEDNYTLFKYKLYDNSAGNLMMSRKIYYIKKDSLNFGILEATFLNDNFGSGSSMLFEINDSEKSVYLTASKNSLDKIEKKYERLEYYRLPPDNDTVRWNYEKNGGKYNCSSFWLLKKGKDKQLVIVRESFPDNTKEKFGKEIEYYMKNQGLINLKIFGASDKLLMEQRVLKRGYDSTASFDGFDIKSSPNSQVAGQEKEKTNVIVTLEHLKRHKGKYSTESKLLDDVVLRKRLIDLIGRKRYNFMKETWAVEGGVIVKNNILQAEGCEAHNCDMTNFMIIADLKTNILYVGYREDGEVQLFGEDNNYPNNLSYPRFSRPKIVVS